MDRFSNLLQLANFPMPHGGPQMPPWQHGMFPPAFGGPGSTGSQQYGGMPMFPGSGFGMNQSNGGYGNLMAMNQFGRFGFGGY